MSLQNTLGALFFKWRSYTPIPLLAAMLILARPTLTSIVIGVGVQALALTMAVRLRQAYGTLAIREIRARMEQDISDAAHVSPPASQEEPAGGRPLLPPGPAGLIASKGASS